VIASDGWKNANGSSLDNKNEVRANQIKRRLKYLKYRASDVIEEHPARQVRLCEDVCIWSSAFEREEGLQLTSETADCRKQQSQDEIPLRTLSGITNHLG